MAEKRNVIDNVAAILEKFPSARKNDKLLFAYYWALVDEVNIKGTSKEFIDSFTEKATPPSSIQRARQTLHYDTDDNEKYLPDDADERADMYMKRRKKEEIFRDKTTRTAHLRGE